MTEKEKKQNYYLLNKAKIAEQRKVYYEKNKETIKSNKKNNYVIDKNVIKEKMKIYYEKNKDGIIERNKKYNMFNKDKKKLYDKNYVVKNKEKIFLKNKNYRTNNKQLISNYTKTRRANDVVFRLSDNIRSLIRQKIKKNGYTKKSKTYEILGCSFEEFKLHLESKFEPWMSWDNYGKYNGELNYGWDIDHIIPVSSAKTEEELIKLNHYTNLQPLCSYTNRDIKRNKFIYL